MMRWEFRATEIDESGYYYPRWDRAIPITVDAENREDAGQVVLTALGKPRRGRGWGWTLHLDRVGPIPASAVPVDQEAGR